MTTKAPARIPIDAIAKQITLIRGQRVILDSDLAALYGVSTKAFNQAVKRNQARFPNDFMFQLTKDELEFWRSQIVTSNSRAKMGLRRAPYAFTEHGAYMAGNVLKSNRATEVTAIELGDGLEYAKDSAINRSSGASSPGYPSQRHCRHWPGCDAAY